MIWSPSAKAITSPSAASTPALRAAERQERSVRGRYSLRSGYVSDRASTISPVPSVEPSSTSTTSNASGAATIWWFRDTRQGASSSFEL